MAIVAIAILGVRAGCRRKCHLLHHLQRFDYLLELVVTGACERATALWTLVVQLAIAFFAHRMPLATLHYTAIVHDKTHWAQQWIAPCVGLNVYMNKKIKYFARKRDYPWNAHVHFTVPRICIYLDIYIFLRRLATYILYEIDFSQIDKKIIRWKKKWK